MLGVNAALAAQRGYQCEESVLETPHGFFEAFGGIDGAAGAAIATRGLGESWDICTDMAIKLVPGGHPYHAIAEAAANAAREANVAAADVASITIARPGMTKLSGPLHPTDLIDMAHSPAYFAAAGVADRAFSWDACECGEDRGSGDPRADRPRAGWRAAHRGCRTLSAGRDGHHCHA